MNILDVYQNMSGQTINCSKSSITFSKNVPPHTRDILCQISGFHKANPMDKYLGIPLGISDHRINHYSWLLDRVTKKLDGWKMRFLSTAGRTALIKSTLSHLPIHIMSIKHLPKGIIKRLETSHNQFWWAHAGGKNKIHFRSWSAIKKPRKDGGLGDQRYIHYE